MRASPTVTTRSSTSRRWLAGLGAVTVLAAACGSSGGSSTATTAAEPATTAGASSTTTAPGATATPHSGTVAVLYAGSLVALMEKAVEPAFHAATGYTVNGFGAGSKDLAADIKGKVKQGDVFLSASPKVDATLLGAANGSWLSWYAKFATSSLAIGYNPKSKFAADLKSKLWYQVVTEPGFRLGLTPPASDPKGVLAVKALDDTASAKSLPALTKIGAATSNQFPETGLVGQLQSGQLDAGFFYLAEADSSGIPTVPLTGVDLAADYTVGVLNKAPHAAAAEAFVAYLLGPAGLAAMKKHGFTVVSPPKVTGTGVPTALHRVLGGS